jgi:hypothetical protein
MTAATAAYVLNATDDTTVSAKEAIAQFTWAVKSSETYMQAG